MPRPLLYRLQYRKKSGGNLKKVRRKKMFSPESMTKLEDLTVCIGTLQTERVKANVSALFSTLQAKQAKAMF
jgi:hypothetical protein